MKQARSLRQASLTAAFAAGACLLAGTAFAQMYEKPYSPQARDRAGLAVYMKNLEESRRNTVTSSGGGDATYLVCGGSGGQYGHQRGDQDRTTRLGGLVLLCGLLGFVSGCGHG